MGRAPAGPRGFLSAGTAAQVLCSRPFTAFPPPPAPTEHSSRGGSRGSSRGGSSTPRPVCLWPPSWPCHHAQKHRLTPCPFPPWSRALLLPVWVRGLPIIFQDPTHLSLPAKTSPIAWPETVTLSQHSLQRGSCLGVSPSLLLLLSCFSHVQLCATPWTAAHQAPLSMGFSRQE